MTKNEEIKQIFEQATKEINRILESCSKMNAKYFCWIEFLSKELKTDKELINAFCRNQFLSEKAIFNKITFRKQKSLSELKKNEWINFLSDVNNYFETNFNIILE